MSIKNAFFPCLLAALWLARPAAALKCELEIDGDLWDEQDPPLGLEQCLNAETELTFKVSGGSEEDKLEVLVGNGEECENPDEDDDCRTIADQVELKYSGDIETEFRDFDLKTLLGDQSCEAAGDRTVYVTFRELATSDEAEVSTTTAATCSFELDTVAPAAIQNVKGGSGENTIEVTWDEPSDDVDRIYMYVEVVDVCPPQLPDDVQDEDDAGTDPDASVPQGSAEGTNASVLQDWKERAEHPDEDLPGTSKSHELTRAVAVGEQAAVWVAAVDEAGNMGPLSDVACIQGVRTIGFCDLNEEHGGKCESGCSVSAVDGSGASWLLPVALAVVALALSARRRRA